MNQVNAYNKHKEQINYLLVGSWNTLFGYLAFAALYFLFRSYVHYMILFVISSVLSITNAYLAYKLFVFKTKGHYWREYSRFYVVYGGALALNLALLPLVVVTFRLSPVIAQAGLAFITVICSYFGHKNFSFKTSAAVALVLLLASFAAARPAGAEVNLLDQYYTWGTLGPQTVVAPADGGLKITSSGGFAGFYNQKMASALLEDNGLLVLEMKTSTGRTGTIFWSNYQDQRFLPQRSWQFYLGRPGVWHRYYIDLGVGEKELTRIDYLLINPFSGSGEAQIRDLRFVKGSLTDRLHAGWQEFLGARGREVVGYTINTMPSVMLFGREIFVYIYWLVALLAAAFLALELWPVVSKPEKAKIGKGKKEKKSSPTWPHYELAFNRAVKKLLVCVLVLWAALELSSLYSDWLNLQNDLPLFGKNIEEKRTLVNSGDFDPFVQFCQAKLPPGVPFDMRIPPIYNDIKAIYYLYPHVNTTEADYLIVYDQPLEPELRGRYEPVAVFRPNAMVLKKVKN